MTYGQIRMLEIAGDIAHHPDFFHDANRAVIRGHGERHNFIERKVLKGMLDDGQSAFRGKTLPPDITRETPADLHARSEVRMERWRVKPNVPDESAIAGIVAKFGGVQAKTFRAKMFLDAIDHRVAFLAGQTLRKKLHYPGIGVESRKGLAIAWPPIS